ncbi:hypothetical protein BLA14095_00633 [Burkholderia lata]|uniref:DUF3311 domain-containing protein n=1 Tax=Burkholderia lata (strain ATCC 17760 / DSM 23089 / LMG 22485 / NCIMB 9086 / R18194 / 383) TaxID=482957 RepID=UPI0014534ADC|nr:DUF3311 domain-containing protein [Burkholderia lata]VWB19617.1 hypothetical protein BLA14095_00633 [Burkholderia lata]
MNHLPIKTVPARHIYRWLLAIPFVWQAALAPAINDVAWAPFGMPFPMLWQMTGIVLTSAVIALVFRLDRAQGIEREEAAFIAATSAAQATEDAQ